MSYFKIIYVGTKALFTALMLYSVSMYLSETEMISGAFANFGYPTYLVYPLAIAKILGLIVLWQTKFKTLKEWVYAGFFYNVILAFFAHTMINDGEHLFALIGLILIVTNYITYKKLKK
jgi:hypothetical protein